MPIGTWFEWRWSQGGLPVPQGLGWFEKQNLEYCLRGRQESTPGRRMGQFCRIGHDLGCQGLHGLMWQPCRVHSRISRYSSMLLNWIMLLMPGRGWWPSTVWSRPSPGRISRSTRAAKGVCSWPDQTCWHNIHGHRGSWLREAFIQHLDALSAGCLPFLGEVRGLVDDICALHAVAEAVTCQDDPYQATINWVRLSQILNRMCMIFFQYGSMDDHLEILEWILCGSVT